MSKTNPQNDPVWSILPSYDMYHSCFYGEEQPPEYDVNSTITSASNISCGNTAPTEVSSQQHDRNHVTHSDTDVIVADQTTTSWKETILDNIHNLRNFTHSDNPYSRNIDIGVHFTAEVGEVGVQPVHIDPSKFEYKQGDYVNGYVHLKNNHSEPIPFEMFYVLFEGDLTVSEKDPGGMSTRRTARVKKFLEMYDFAASWNPVQMQVNRLLKESNKHYDIEKTWDPVDNSANSMDRNIIQPGVLYKRFFTFKIPENMLDTECMDHKLAAHTRLPPTLGISEEELLQMPQSKKPVSDFAFPDTCTSYGVLARFIGKASSYDVLDAKKMKTKLTDSSGDEYVIISQKTGFLRVVLDDSLPSEAEKVVNREANRVLYDNLINRLEDKIKEGRELQDIKRKGEQNFRQFIANTDYHVHPENLQDCRKISQLYTQLDNVTKNKTNFEKPKEYNITVPVKRNNFLRGSKIKGTLSVKSPKHEYMIDYQWCKQDQAKESKLQIPVNITYIPQDPKFSKAPEIVKIEPQLVAFTMSTPKHPIPIELNHDLLFRNKCSKFKNTSKDNFQNIVLDPMKQYAKDLATIIREVGAGNLMLEGLLQQDLTALSHARSKENRLRLRESTLTDPDGTIHDIENLTQISLLETAKGVYSKSFSVNVDILKAQKYSLDRSMLPDDYCANTEMCLVPSFQTCFLARMYYLRLVITFSTEDKVELKLPATVVKLTP